MSLITPRSALMSLFTAELYELHDKKLTDSGWRLPTDIILQQMMTMLEADMAAPLFYFPFVILASKLAISANLKH